jgi:hypothetical protein
MELRWTGSMMRLLIAVACLMLCAALAPAQAQTAPAAKPIGTIKALSGKTITLISDAGPIFNVTVDDGAKIMRIEPGAKDLKNASPLQIEDLQVGDRILVLGKVSDDGHSVAANSVIAMKKADVASKQERDQQEWQRNGVGGLVSDVDPTGGTVTISAQSLAGSRNIVIQASKSAIVRRYAADSVKFDDAKPSSLDQIKRGDQVRARGTRNADGSQLTADEIVSGAFRNIAGTVATVDPATNTVSINDLVTKKPVEVKITAESQLRKLSPQMAQAMAVRLKGGAAGGGAANSPANGAGDGQAPAAQGSATRGSGNAAGSGGGNVAGAGGGRGTGGRNVDIQQLLSRVPAASLSDLQKGDAVMIVSTEGTAGGGVTAITLVAGVEPILQASPNGANQSMILPPWSLDAPGGGGDAAQ